MCGIFNWSGKDPKSFNKSKFDILGIMNETRGRHSCGVSFDNMMWHGVDGNKEYRDFVANNNSITMENVPIALGHTRWATGGAHNLDNAHPFGFLKPNSDAEEYVCDFVGVHNGSLYNEKNLALKFDIKTNAPSETTDHKGVTVISNRTKIDSEILLESIFRSESFKPLSEYDGAAALMWYHRSEPNVTYYYHGASLYNPSSTDSTEERPLYYYQETSESLYVSSIRESLEVIGGTDETIGEFKHNTVYKVKDGNVSNANKFAIDRKGKYQKQTWGSQHKAGKVIEKNVSKPLYNNSKYDRSDLNLNNIKGGNNFNSNRGEMLPTTFPGIPLRINSENTDLPQNDYKGSIYFNKLLFWKNGHEFTGAAVWLKNAKVFHPLGYFINSNHAIRSFKQQCLDREYSSSTGMFLLKGVSSSTSNLEFSSDMNDQDIESSIFWFKSGVMLKTKLDYDQVISLMNFDKLALSHCSAHPIINNASSFPNSDVILNGVKYTGSFNIFCSDFIYTFSKGELLSKLKRKSHTLDLTSKEQEDLIREQADKDVQNPNNDSCDIASDRGKIVNVTDEDENEVDGLSEDELEAYTMIEAMFTQITKTLKDKQSQLDAKYKDNAMALMGYEAMEDMIDEIEGFKSLVEIY